MAPTSDHLSTLWLGADDVSAHIGDTAAACSEISLRERDLLVLVGFTGAGKSTTLAALADRGTLAAILPDRRELTDRIILPAMSEDPTRKVTDRLERFALTAAFRERHPGGMGEVLEGLSITRVIPDGLIAFDGLRGKAEIMAAIRIPRARFLVLDTSPDIRMARLCLRDDPFDRAAVLAPDAAAPTKHATRNRLLEILRRKGMDELLGPSALDRLAERLTTERVAPEMVETAAAIVVDEAQHYSAQETLATLSDLAPDRTMTFDSGTLPPSILVDRIIERLALQIQAAVSYD